jgi:outer membrane protein TolC
MVLAGCAVGPDFMPPDALDVSRLTPTSLHAPGAAGGETQRFVRGLDIPGKWWTLFHSRPLNDLIERALRDNNDLQAAQAALRVANANVEAQIGFFYPTIDASHNSTRAKIANGDVASPVNSPSPFYTLHTAQLTMTFIPDVFGGNRRQVESLESVAEMQRFQLEATYLTLTSNLAAAAIQEASLRGQIHATENIIKIQKELLERRRWESSLPSNAIC